MNRKKCVHQRLARLGKCVLQPIPTHVETVVLLSREKVDGYVEIDLDVEKVRR